MEVCSSGSADPCSQTKVVMQSCSDHNRKPRSREVSLRLRGCLFSGGVLRCRGLFCRLLVAHITMHSRKGNSFLQNPLPVFARRAVIVLLKQVVEVLYRRKSASVSNFGNAEVDMLQLFHRIGQTEKVDIIDNR